MAQDTLLGFPAHTLPYRCGKFITLSTASDGVTKVTPPFLCYAAAPRTALRCDAPDDGKADAEIAKFRRFCGVPWQSCRRGYNRNRKGTADKRLALKEDQKNLTVSL